MGIQLDISTIGIKMTMVPPEDECDKTRKYYVYEWFIKDSGEVFYVGKGTGKRYLQNKNEEFARVKNAFDSDVRIVKNKLNEYEALVLEEELIIKRHKQGNVLTNAIVPVDGGGAYFIEQKLSYMKTPIAPSTRIDKHYFNLYDLKYDCVKKDKLLSTCIKWMTVYGLWGLYFKNANELDDKTRQDETDKRIRRLIGNVEKYVIENNGRMYKTIAKSAKSVIAYGDNGRSFIDKLHEKGYEVYHLIDVLKFIDSQNVSH